MTVRDGWKCGEARQNPKRQGATFDGRYHVIDVWVGARIGRNHQAAHPIQNNLGELLAGLSGGCSCEREGGGNAGMGRWAALYETKPT